MTANNVRDRLQNPISYSQKFIHARPKMFSGNRVEQIYTNMMSQFFGSSPSRDILVIQLLIVLCNCLIAGPDSLSITEILNSVFNWEVTNTLLFYQILPRHVKAVIGKFGLYPSAHLPFFVEDNKSSEFY